MPLEKEKIKPKLVLIVRDKPKIFETKLLDVPIDGQTTNAWRIEIYGNREIIIDYT